MSTTVNVSPTTTAINYWANSSYTSLSPYTRALAGTTSNVYHYPIPFDLSAYASKQLVSLKLFVKFSSDSNTFSGSEHLDVGYTTLNATAAQAHAATLLDTLLPVDNTFCEFDVSAAWTTLKAGLTYLVLSSDDPNGEYAVLYTNYGTVNVNDRPYLQLIYNEPTQVYGNDNAWHYAIANKVYGNDNAWHDEISRKVYDGAAWKTVY